MGKRHSSSHPVYKIRPRVYIYIFKCEPTVVRSGGLKVNAVEYLFNSVSSSHESLLYRILSSSYISTQPAASTVNPFSSLEKTININNVPYKYYDISAMGAGYGKDKNNYTRLFLKPK